MPPFYRTIRRPVAAVLVVVLGATAAVGLVTGPGTGVVAHLIVGGAAALLLAVAVLPRARLRLDVVAFLLGALALGIGWGSVEPRGAGVIGYLLMIAVAIGAATVALVGHAETAAQRTRDRL